MRIDFWGKEEAKIKQREKESDADQLTRERSAVMMISGSGRRAVWRKKKKDREEKRKEKERKQRKKERKNERKKERKKERKSEERRTKERKKGGERKREKEREMLWVAVSLPLLHVRKT